MFNIQLSNEDYDLFWDFLDVNRNGKITFNEFFRLGDLKSYKMNSDAY